MLSVSKPIMFKVVIIDNLSAVLVRRPEEMLSFLHTDVDLSLDALHLEDHLHGLVKVFAYKMSRVVLGVLGSVEKTSADQDRDPAIGGLKIGSLDIRLRGVAYHVEI